VPADGAGKISAVRRLAVLSCLALVLAPGAHAAPPTVTATVSAAAGQAPLAVTLTASGDAATYSWALGDGTTATGAAVQHTYGTGLWTATVVATAADGESAQTQVEIRSETVSLAAPKAAVYGRTVELTGSLRPAAPGVPVTLSNGATVAGRGRTGPNGGFRIRMKAGRPGNIVAKADQATSEPAAVAVRPLVTIALVGDSVLYGRLRALVRLRPAGAGSLAVTVRRAGKAVRTLTGRTRILVPLDTRTPGRIVVAARARTSAGWLQAAAVDSTTVAYPRIAVGESSPALGELRARLAALGYAVPPPSSSFDYDFLDSVYAFEKVQGLPRTGVVDPAFWAKLDHPRRPRPRYTEPADHLEVDKATQVLYIVRGGRVATIVPVSTAGLPGRFTPVGRFAIYRKVSGFDPSPLGTLFDPLYFTGGYAIHGNPTVPPYPASHGCVRVPMWIAPTLYATNDYGETVDVY